MQIFEKMKFRHQVHQNSIERLRREWLALVIFGAGTLLAGFFLLRTNWQPGYAVRWLGLSLLGFIYLLWVLWSILTENHRPGEEKLLGTFGAGNYLTIFRGFLVAWLLGFVFSPRPHGWLAWLPGTFYTSAAIIDLFDGYYARIRNHATQLGEILDLKLDSLGVLVAVLLAVRYGQVPAWYLLVGLARYLFLAGIWLRERLGKTVHELPESPRRRPFAGALMGFLAVILWPFFSPPGTRLAALLFATPFLVSFAWDWLAVSGTVKASDNPGEASHKLVDADKLNRWKRFISTSTPLILRAAVVSLAALSLIQWLPDYRETLRPVFAAAGYPFTALDNIVTLLLFATGTVLLALGAAGRIASLAILFSLGLHQRTSAFTVLDVLIIVGAASLFFLGTGAYSLWKPEDRLIQRRLGQL